MRKTRLFRSQEQAELVGAIADTLRCYEANGRWAEPLAIRVRTVARG
jgi:hypothetical protein